MARGGTPRQLLLRMPHQLRAVGLLSAAHTVGGAYAPEVWRLGRTGRQHWIVA